MPDFGACNPTTSVKFHEGDICCMQISFQVTISRARLSSASITEEDSIKHEQRIAMVNNGKRRPVVVYKVDKTSRPKEVLVMGTLSGGNIDGKDSEVNDQDVAVIAPTLPKDKQLAVKTQPTWPGDKPQYIYLFPLPIDINQKIEFWRFNSAPHQTYKLEPISFHQLVKVVMAWSNDLHSAPSVGPKYGFVANAIGRFAAPASSATVTLPPITENREPHAEKTGWQSKRICFTQWRDDETEPSIAVQLERPADTYQSQYEAKRYRPMGKKRLSQENPWGSYLNLRGKKNQWPMMSSPSINVY
ncbi:hypothetical protein BU17DRAFT_78705 [Hysterangium stoloniferum]|nr:hypothetical protein BU17DRAFT_78705 [Hysterangium stoloniferum]